MKQRRRFAWLPTKVWSARYYRDGGTWLRWVTEVWLDGEWKAFLVPPDLKELDNPT